MQIASNKIKDIIRFFRNELIEKYESDELETIIGYCFEEFTTIGKAELILRGEETISESDLLKINFAIKDLKLQKPIQYILGKADFYGMKFLVNPSVLIPRPETEELVHLIIKENRSVKTEILDIGTGSGCIAIALKKNIAMSKVYAFDISETAIEVARRNAANNNQKIIFFIDDVFELDNKITSQKFDIIVSNPPYVCNFEKEKMNKNVLDYEPHLALFVADTNPLMFYKNIADYALSHLNLNGKLYFEINSNFALEIKNMLEQKGFKNVNLLSDLNQKIRIVKCDLSS